MARFKTRQSFLVADAPRPDRSSIELACIKFWMSVQDFKTIHLNRSPSDCRRYSFKKIPCIILEVNPRFYRRNFRYSLKIVVLWKYYKMCHFRLYKCAEKIFLKAIAKKVSRRLFQKYCIKETNTLALCELARTIPSGVRPYKADFYVRVSNSLVETYGIREDWRDTHEKGAKA